MIVFIKENLAILANPKTGTTALEQAIGNNADLIVRNPSAMKHFTISQFNFRFRAMCEKFSGSRIETMCLVREPVDWLGSWYRYRQRDDVAGHSVSTRGISFDQFVLDYLAEERPVWADVGDQVKFVTEKSGSVGVDYVFQYEQWPLAIEFLQHRLPHLAQHMQLPRANMSPQTDLTLAAPTRQALERACADQFELWHNIAL